MRKSGTPRLALVIPAFRRLKQENHCKIQTSLSYRVRARLPKQIGQKIMNLSDLIRETSICRRWQLTQRSQPVQAQSRRPWAAGINGTSVNTPAPRLGDQRRRGGG